MDERERDQTRSAGYRRRAIRSLDWPVRKGRNGSRFATIDVTLVVHEHLNWMLRGAREAGAMVWMTFWMLVSGFALSGAVQSFVRRDTMGSSLGRDSIATTSRASLLGVISSSCSDGCRGSFLSGGSVATRAVTLTRKPSRD